MPPGCAKACDEPSFHRILHDDHNDRRGRQATLRGDTLYLACRHDHVNPALGEICNELRETFLSPAGESPLKGDILALDIAEFTKLLQKSDPDWVRFDGIRSYRKETDL